MPTPESFPERGPQVDPEYVLEHLDEYTDDQLRALQQAIPKILQARWWAQHGSNAATLKVLSLFNDDKTAAWSWMAHPHSHLGSRAPIDLAQTPDGLQEVLRALARIEHGVFV